ncbi:hypothetical protein HYPSUDRAFT_756731 [Hypholoma sublateritium FD-334 SS-4]|uniref:RING-type domain-containing protein n=1 Tax=Hypholoma sublateritium (strain FD-334 SS-4) TaxID=945553 RepID=A0A0D2NQG9_HYPSF|nr:hypothetical protein HYPSUDRAFT_756731 [Hypholoma sublateritium FD-334 SS-4]
MSSGLVLTQCPACKESNIPIARMLFLHCGHNVCIDCITQCNSKCPACRTRIVAGTPHRIYLGVEDIAQHLEIPTVKVEARTQPEKAAIKVEKERGKPLVQCFEDVCEANAQLLEEIQQLKRSLQKAKRESDAKSAEIEGKDETIVRYKTAYQRKKQEVQDLQEARGADERKMHLLNAKLKALVREKAKKSRRRSSGNGDASLQIEDNAELISTSRQYDV